MANGTIDGMGSGEVEWAEPLFRWKDESGNVVASIDKSGNMTVTGVLAYGSVANLSGAFDLANDFAINTNKFTVASATGNTVVAGTLTVDGASTLTGAVTASDTLAVSGASTLTGNVSAGGTLSVTGTTTAAAINASGAVGVDGNFDVANTKFTVAAATGNTVVAGTLAVTGASTLTGNVTASGTLGVTGATTLSDTLAVTGASTLTGNVSAGGTLTVTGTTTAAAINASGAVGVDGNFDVANTKFTVAAASGNTVVGGTLAVTGATTLTGALTSNGATVIDDSLVVNEAGADKDTRIEGDTVTDLFFVDASTDRVGIGTTTPSVLFDVDGAMNVAGAITGGSSTDITINTDKFTVAASSGNTVIGGTLGVTGVATFTAMPVLPTGTKASNATGTAGQISWDADYIYICTATNTWERAALTGGY